MRIIAGRFGGRILQVPKSLAIRPTTDRVKESVFSILSDRIVDAEVLDLFSGTGNLSFESLSRGALSSVAVEKSKDSLEVIQLNARKLGLKDEELTVVKKDVFQFVKNYSESPFDIVLVDPPFTEKIADRVMKEISESRLFKEGTVIVIESTIHETIGDFYGPLKLIDRRSYGDKLASFFSPTKDEL